MSLERVGILRRVLGGAAGLVIAVGALLLAGWGIDGVLGPLTESDAGAHRLPEGVYLGALTLALAIIVAAPFLAAQVAWMRRAPREASLSARPLTGLPAVVAGVLLLGALPLVGAGLLLGGLAVAVMTPPGRPARSARRVRAMMSGRPSI